jgi:D-alanyl-lipoteichoic acid acyltransferase DltB (MBOAT superfamily)
VVDFSTYVAFFPSILSGPIDRPNALIPQLQTKRVFDYNLAADGCRQILLGLFKKLVIANNCAVYVDAVYENFHSQSGSTLILAAVLFSFQLYTDFSGYSDMAIGVGKILGFRITNNFNYPFFAQNIAEYWRKWHISLTSWLTDYVFMPLNVRWRNAGNWGMIAAIVLTFFLIGLWHGSNYTFAVFGLYHGLLYIPLILSGKMFKKTKIKTYNWGFPKLNVLGNMLLTFVIVTFGNIIFRADSISDALGFMGKIFNLSIFAKPMKLESVNLFIVLFFIALMLITEWLQRQKVHALEITNLKPWLRHTIYLLVIFCIIWFTGKNETFIYFQF